MNKLACFLLMGFSVANCKTRSFSDSSKLSDHQPLIQTKAQINCQPMMMMFVLFNGKFIKDDLGRENANLATIDESVTFQPSLLSRDHIKPVISDEKGELNIQTQMNMVSIRKDANFWRIETGNSSVSDENSLLEFTTNTSVTQYPKAEFDKLELKPTLIAMGLGSTYSMFLVDENKMAFSNNSEFVLLVSSNQFSLKFMGPGTSESISCAITFQPR